MSQLFYVAEVRVKKIEVLEDGNRAGGSHLFAKLQCKNLKIEYVFRDRVTTGDTIDASPLLFRSLFKQTGATDQPKVKFGLEVGGDFMAPLPPNTIGWEPSVTATITIDLDANAKETTWWIETHVNSVRGQTARLKISFDLTTYKVAGSLTGQTLLGFRDEYAQGTRVDLMDSSRKVKGYPKVSDGPAVLEGVWRTNFNQMGAVGNDQLSSLVASTDTPLVVYVYQHAFDTPTFLSGMRKIFTMGGYHPCIVNLGNHGMILRWPPVPSLDNNVSAIEVALQAPPPPIH